jgi:hypothetical protein
MSVQAQTDPIHTSRKIDWTSAGVPGGIPNRTTICSTLNPGATAAQIDAAIASCPEGQVVFLTAGTYNITGIDFAGKNNVTLRGAGPDATLLVFSASGGCHGLLSNICIRTASPHHGDNMQNEVQWTAGYAKGTTVLTLSSVPNITPNSTILILDQHNDSSDPGDIFICTEGAVCVVQGESGSYRTDVSDCTGDECARAQHQIVLVTAVDGNDVTISPGLYMPNWRSGRAPEAWYADDATIGNGIEDLSVDHTDSDEKWAIGIMNAYGCWVKNVRSIKANRAHIVLIQTDKVEIRDSYFTLAKSAASQSYGIEFRMTSDTLVENNIFYKLTGPYVTSGMGGGGVAGYNYMLENVYTVATWMVHGFSLHGLTQMTLFEGNAGNGYQSDNVHTSRHFNTVFRNQFDGWQTGKTQQTLAILIYNLGRYDNIIGNVLGTDAYHTNYECFPPSGTSYYTSIYAVGWSSHGSEHASVPNDVFSYQSMMRWGNYDTVNDAVRWVAGEVPSGISPYANPVPGDQTLIDSYYLASRPAWFDTPWGNVPWPPVGPDVTGGDVPDVGGYAYKIPARLCYENMPGAGDIRDFNADDCYDTGYIGSTVVSGAVKLSGAVKIQ